MKFVVPLPEGKYFKPSEMRCRDGTPYPEEWSLRLGVLFEALDTIREAWGGPIRIVSGYRSPAHNKELTEHSLDVAKASQHVKGRAADIRPIKSNFSVGDVNRLHSIVNELLADGKLPEIGGVGIYTLIRDKRTNLLFPGFVHVDTRARYADGRIARWEGGNWGDERTG